MIATGANAHKQTRPLAAQSDDKRFEDGPSPTAVSAVATYSGRSHIVTFLRSAGILPALKDAAGTAALQWLFLCNPL